jgi:hypothetical protein
MTSTEKRKFKLQYLTLLLLTFLIHSSLRAQSSTGTLSGTVVDQSDAVVPGAQITLENTATTIRRETVTSDQGGFVFASLQPGEYKLTAHLPGFASVEMQRIVINVSDQRSVRVQLKPSGVSETVSVTDVAPLVNEAPARATVVDRTFVENQPLNGRTFQTLIALSPGVVFAPANVTLMGQFSVNGQRTGANYFMVDGVSGNFGLPPAQNMYEGAGGGVPSFSVQGGTSTLASIDAVQEFAVQTSMYAPEFGRQPGAQISIATRSGTNQLHGTVFDYLRNDVFDANNFFANANRLRKPVLRQNDFGGVVGGPIYLPGWYDGRNRTFFFVSYEGLRLRQPQVTPTMLVPSLAARQAATGLVKDLLDAYPLPNGAVSPTNPDIATFIGGYSNPSKLDATSVRIDHKIGNRLSIFGRYHHAPTQSHERAKFAAASSVARLPNNADTATFALTATLSANAIYDVRANHSRSRAAQIYSLDDFGGAIVPPLSSRYLPFSSPDTGVFNVNGGSSNETLTDGLLSDNRQHQLNLVQNLSSRLGSHSLKFGFDYRRLTPTNRVGDFQRFLTFTNLSQMATGIAASAIVLAVDSDLHLIYSNYSAYVQDIWHATPQLALTYGLRYELNSSPRETSGKMPPMPTSLDDLATATLASPDTRLYETPKFNFAPRIGFSYRPFSRSDTTLRGGFGVFYDLGYGFAGSAFVPTFYPYARRADLVAVPITSPQFSAQPPAPSLDPPYPRLFAYDKNYRLPYTLQYTFGVDQPIGGQSVIALSYVGASGRRLGRLESLRNPTPNFTRIDIATNDGRSNYNAFQAQYNRRLSRGLQALVSYTWAKSIDTASEESITTFYASSSRYDPQQDRGASTFDVRHALNGAVSYMLPAPFRTGFGKALLGNFTLDTIFNARSATPVNILTGRDAFGLGFTTVSRPDLVPGAPLYLRSDVLPGGKRINLAAFDSVAPLAEKRQGTFGRNVVRGFPVYQVDLSLRRSIPIREQVALQIRADAFNILNHPNFASPSGIMTDATFGRATQMLNTGLAGLNPLFQTGGPRSLQLALKLSF